ncbi:MAG: tetratricopeptide repeat protein [Thiotrichaceae bacterium]|nr:tetratricopeptide repeat protein [Thiotrichaceae bacterium]
MTRPSIFIGREKEIKDFWDTLENSKQRILHIQAAGGMGKTKLLTEFINQLEGLPRDKTAIYPNEPIDLYHTTYQIELGILTSIASQFPSSFKSFREHISKYRREPSSTAQEELRDEFVKCYRELKANYIVLFFDTVEEINEPIKNFFHAVFPRLLEAQPSTLIVTAGRKPFPIAKLDPSIKIIKLEGFKQRDIINYFQHDEIRSLIDTDFCDNDELLKKLADLSQGKPILIGLTVDWMRHGNFPENLLDMPPEVFEENLVKQIESLSKPENQVILAMAHFYRRFDEKILVALFPELTPTEKEAIAFIKNMNRYSFVKYRELNKTKYRHFGGIHSCLLHDEMRELVENHIWSYLDSNRVFSKSWTAIILDYYNSIIEKITVELDKNQPDELKDELVLELRSLQREKLSYFCFFNFDSGFLYYRGLRNEVLDSQSSWQSDMLQACLEILSVYERQMNTEQYCIYSLHKSYIYFYRSDYSTYIDEAKNILCLENIKPYSPDVAESQAKTVPKCIQALTNAGKIIEAIEFSKQQKVFSEQSKSSSNTIKRQHGEFFAAMGYTFRRQGYEDKPREYYEKAMAIYRELERQEDPGKSSFYLASVEVNFGFTLHLLGKDYPAMAQCENALARSADKNIWWRAYNVLGIIEADAQRTAEAIQYFDLALVNAEYAKNKRGIALINIAQGRMYRQQGWFKVRGRKQIEAAEPDYAKAYEHLKKAISVLANKLDTQQSPDLAEAYIEMGLLLREQSQFKEALEYFEKSKNLAEQYNNNYLIADSLKCIAITFSCIPSELAQAKIIAEKAIETASVVKGLHIIARAEKVLAEVAHDNKDYGTAFKHAVSSIIHLLQVDPNSQDDSIPKKGRLYNEMRAWLKNLINHTPERDKYLQLMCEEWERSDLSKADKERWAFNLFFSPQFRGIQ